MILSPSICLLSVTLLVGSLVSIEARLLYAYKDPHIRSVIKGDEVCDYYTDVWFPCFESGYFSAYCIFTKIPGYSIVSAIQLKFTANDAKTIEAYTVTNANFQLKTHFDSGSTSLADQYGNPWLELIVDQYYPGTPGYSSIVIKDYNTATSVSITQDGMYNLFLHVDNNTALWGSGLLVEGCPKGFLNPSSGRRKRSVSECDYLLASKDKSFDEKVIRSICEHDIQFIPDVADKIRQDIESVNKFSQIHSELLAELKEIKAKEQEAQKERGK